MSSFIELCTASNFGWSCIMAGLIKWPGVGITITNETLSFEYTLDAAISF